MKKIYTRRGDDGTTSLFGGSRVVKTHPRIEAYGTVDETNAHLGVARSLLPEQDAGDEAYNIVDRLQDELFILGADLATREDAKTQVERISPAHTERLENDIDALSEDLPPLKHFILPGGTQAAATLHLARTTCRRAERFTVAAGEPETINRETVRYLNRLSDLLFVLARWLNHRAGVEEAQWAGMSDSKDDEATR